MADAPYPSPQPSEASRLLLMLRTWEAISRERELPGVLASLADVLVPIVPFDSVGIIDFTKPLDVPREDGEQHRLLALHVVGVPGIEGETPQQLAVRLGDHAKPEPLPDRPVIPYPPAHDPPDFDGEPHACDDLLERDTWFRHEAHLAKDGIRSYASVPLVMRGEVIGVAAFIRVKQRNFPPSELAILKDVSRALSIATANALA
ncbi:MAG TPA: GAF domain-containing protein, partial [Candidatus Acidoferrum sp.]